MKIDVFCHILPEKYVQAVQKKAVGGSGDLDRALWFTKNAALGNMEVRLRVLDRYPDVLQVPTIATPPLETMVAPSDAIECAKIANDELAELVEKYPNKFLSAVACLPLNDIDAALEETDRAISKLKLKGVQIFSNIKGKSLDCPEFRPLFAKMAQYDLPIWIHPWWKGPPYDGLLGWPVETTQAMMGLALAGIFEDYPDIKFITHHCGGMVPFFERRIWWFVFQRKLSEPAPGERHVKDAFEHLRRFYNDTAVYGVTSSLMCGREFFGSDHLLFGTDMPLGGGLSGYGPTEDTIRSIDRMEIPADEKAKIFEGNARKLLRLQW